MRGGREMEEGEREGGEERGVFMYGIFAISTRWQSKSNLGRTFNILVSQVETAQNKELRETVEGKVE